MPSSDQSQPTPEQLAKLSALADGSLDPSERSRVEATISSSPELSALYQRERAVVDQLDHARAHDRAPASLHAAVAAQRSAASSVRSSRRWSAGRVRCAGALSAAGAVVAVVLILVLALPGGTVGAPSVSEAAALALRGPAQPAPAPDPAAPTSELSQRVGDTHFPNWGYALGWHAIGVRSDRLDGRAAVTVFYRLGAHEVAYTIVGVPALAEPARGTLTHLHGYTLRTLRLDGRTVVTWRRGAHTCVLSGSVVTASTLRRLAAWGAPGITS